MYDRWFYINLRGIIILDNCSLFFSDDWEDKYIWVQNGVIINQFLNFWGDSCINKWYYWFWLCHCLDINCLDTYLSVRYLGLLFSAPLTSIFMEIVLKIMMLMLHRQMGYSLSSCSLSVWSFLFDRGVLANCMQQVITV